MRRKKALVGVTAVIALVAALALPVAAFAQTEYSDGNAAPGGVGSDVYYVIDTDMGTKTVTDTMRIAVEWEIQNGSLSANEERTWDAENLKWVTKYTVVGENTAPSGSFVVTNYSSCDIETTLTYEPDETFATATANEWIGSGEAAEGPVTEIVETAANLCTDDYYSFDFTNKNKTFNFELNVALNTMEFESKEDIHLGSMTLSFDKIENFTVTASNRAAVGYTGEAGQELVIPQYFVGDGNNGTVKDTKYRVNAIENGAFSDYTSEVQMLIAFATYFTPEDVPTEADVLKQLVEAGYLRSGDENVVLGAVPLKSVTIPSSVNYIGVGAFKYCTTLESVTFDGMDSSSWFDSTEIVKIMDAAFYGCSSLTEIALPSSITELGEAVFYASGLTSYTQSEALSSIQTSLLQYCEKLETVDCGYASKIEDYALYGSGAKTICLTSWCYYIGEYALDCENLETIYFDGTAEEWESITKADSWMGYGMQTVNVECSDQTVVINPPEEEGGEGEGGEGEGGEEGGGE